MNSRIACVVVAVIGGCSTKQLVTNEQSSAEQIFALSANWSAFAQSPPGQPPRGALDILFMVDDSGFCGG